MSVPIIEVDNITAGYDEIPVLRGFSLTIPEGSFTAIVGGNGSGKTTLIRSILALLPIQSGDIRLWGTPLNDFSAWSKIGYLPQTPNHLSSFPASVTEIVSSGLLAEKRFPRRITSSDLKRVSEVLTMLGIGELHRRFISELSGGQRRKVLLARAMVSKPKLLILDEPTTEFDPASRESFYGMVSRLNTEHGVTVLLISHDSGTVGAYASHLAVLDGRLLFHGTFANFCQSEEMCARFGEFAQHLICHQHCDCCEARR